MTWTIEDLKDADNDELIRFAKQEVSTLRQMHAIKELAIRAEHQPDLLPHAVTAIGQHLGHASRIGGLPAGYLGAKVLFDRGDDAQRALLTMLAAASPTERDDLIQWLRPPADSPVLSVPATSLLSERELIVDRSISDDELEQAIRSVLNSPSGTVTVEVLPLAGRPMSASMVSLSISDWETLERQAAQLSMTLNTTIFWLPPEHLGPLDPDLRVAIHPDGRRDLVIARYTKEGFKVSAAVETPPDRGLRPS